MASAYKVGTISEILAKEAEAGGGGSVEKQDPKLAALFGGAGVTSSKVFRTVKVNESEIFITKGPLEKGKIKKERIKLGNKDAAGIRVEAKRKIKIEQVEADSSTLKKKKNKVGKKKISVQDETVSSSSSTATSTKTSPAKSAKKSRKKNKGKLKEVMISEKEEEEGLETKSGSTEKVKVKGKKLKKKKGKVVKVKKELVKQEIEEEEEDVEDEGRQEEDEEEDGRGTEQVQGKGSDYFKTLAERNAPKAKDPELESRTIFVGNIPGDTNKKQLRKLFIKFGSVETVRLRCGAPSKPTQLKKVAINKRDLHSDKTTLAGYVRFKTRDDAEKAAAEARGLMINDNHLVVDLVVKLKTDKRDNKKAIFVGNLNLKLTDEELWRFFEDCGKINTVRIIRDNQTGLGKGFGYVNFDEREAVALALQKNEQELKSREIRISRHIKKMKVKKGEAAQKHTNNQNQRGHDKSNKSAAAGGRSGDKMKGHPARKPDRVNNFGGKEKRKGNINRDEIKEYGGDRLAEIGKLKRKSNKPNKGELRKAKIAKLLTGKAPATVVVSSSHAPNSRQASLNQNATNRKRYFN